MTQTPAPSTTPDPRPLLWRAADQVDALVSTVAPADLDRATPCTGWTVRDLLAHVVAVEDRIVHVAAGGHPFEVPTSIEPVADDGWSAAWRSSRGPLEAALAPDDVLGRLFHHPAGDMPGARALAIYTSELGVHSWDLSRALGDRGIELDQELAGILLGPMTHALPADGRDEVPFADVVAVRADAAPYDRLVGWVGRDPGWTP